LINEIMSSRISCFGFLNILHFHFKMSMLQLSIASERVRSTRATSAVTVDCQHHNARWRQAMQSGQRCRRGSELISPQFKEQDFEMQLG
jgi:hypothetical protein